MRVLMFTDTWKGPTSSDVGDSWRQPSTTWREERINGRKGRRFPRRQVEVVEVTARGTPLMAPSGDELEDYNPRSGKSEDYSLQGSWRNWVSAWLAESELELLLALCLMVVIGSRGGGGSSAEGNSGQTRWHPSQGNLEATNANNS